MSIMLCVDGLPLNLTSKELKILAEAHGHVLRCWVVTGPVNEVSLRFGYIEAVTAMDAKRMMAGLSNQTLNCKPSTVNHEETR
jgi:hypothetical protein